MESLLQSHLEDIRARLTRIEDRLTGTLAEIPQLKQQVEATHAAVFGNGDDGLRLQVDRLAQQSAQRDTREQRRSLWLGGLGAGVGALIVKLLDFVMQ